MANSVKVRKGGITMGVTPGDVRWYLSIGYERVEESPIDVVVEVLPAAEDTDSHPAPITEVEAHANAMAELNLAEIARVNKKGGKK